MMSKKDELITNFTPTEIKPKNPQRTSFTTEKLSFHEK